MGRTVLIVAGYAPVADWLSECLRDGGYQTVAAKDLDEALRLAWLIEIDLAFAWPTVSGFSDADFLAAVSSHVALEGVPVLLVAFREPDRLRPIDGWMRVPLAADKVVERVRLILAREERHRQSSVEAAHSRSRLVLTLRPPSSDIIGRRENRKAAGVR